MTYIEDRHRANGTVSYVVRWREGGSRARKKEYELFDGREAAEKFRDLVDAHGQHWPYGWVRGEGFVEPGTSGRASDPEAMFEPFALRYIELLTGVQGDTKAKYRRQVQQRMLPWFRQLDVTDGPRGIDKNHIAAWVNDLAEGVKGPYARREDPDRSLKPKSIRNLHGLLFGVLQAAVEANPSLRSSNPCAVTRLPQDAGTDEEMTFLEREEFALLLSCVEDEDAWDLVVVLAGTGMRWGEATALKPKDLRRRGRHPALAIQRAWKRDEDGRPVLGPPKTKKSRRTLVLTPQLDEALRRRAAQCSPEDFLFPRWGGEQWGAETFRRQHWLPALRAAHKRGLVKSPRVHDLRHSHASWLIAKKVPLPAIQARLGHESITTTVDRYGHLLDALDGEVADAVAWSLETSWTDSTSVATSGSALNAEEASPGSPPAGGVETGAGAERSVLQYLVQLDAEGRERLLDAMASLRAEDPASAARGVATMAHMMSELAVR